MTAILIAEFAEPDALLRAARDPHAVGRILDGYSPFPVDGLAELTRQPPTKVRIVESITAGRPFRTAHGTPILRAFRNGSGPFTKILGQPPQQNPIGTPFT